MDNSVNVLIRPESCSEWMLRIWSGHKHCCERWVHKWRKDLEHFGVNAVTSDITHVWFGWATASAIHHTEVSLHAHTHTGSQCPSAPIGASVQPLMAINYPASGAKNLTSQVSLCIRPTLHQDSLQDSKAGTLCVCVCVRSLDFVFLHS